MIAHSKPSISDDDINAVNATLASGNIAKGEKVAELENKLACYLHVPLAVSCDSGTSSLVIALSVLSICKGDEVILPTYVCRSVSDAIAAKGATPVFCDVERTGWNISYESAESKITSKTKAIIAVHTFGSFCDISPFKKFGVPIIEDCCQAFGLEHNGIKVGYLADIGFYSFHATKCFATGEGGAVVAKDKNTAQRLNEIHDSNTQPYRMSDIQAVLGLSQLERYDDFLKKRKEIASCYFQNILPSLTEKLSKHRESTIFFRFPLVSRKFGFEKGQLEFAKHKIAVRRGVDTLLHRIYGLSDKEFPNAVNCYNETLSIPIYPALKQEEAERIVQVSNSILA